MRVWAEPTVLTLKQENDMNIFGCKDIGELVEQAPTLRQFAGVERYVVRGGPGDGNEILRVRSGGGLCFEVNVSRGFDIGRCELHGVPISWTSACGYISPAFYDFRGTEWNRGFEGGMLTTCGLQHAGRPEGDFDRVGLHGRSSYIPAEVAECDAYFEGKREIVLRGVVREAKAGGDVLVLYRTIRVPLFESRILVHDEVVNEGGTEAVHMMLYHINMGFPLVSETTRIGEIDAKREIVSGDAEPEDYREMRFMPDANPDVILHNNVKNGSGKTIELRVENEVEWLDRRAKLSLAIEYDKDQCPYLTQWRHFGKKMHVLALEPGNCSTKGMAFHKEEGTLHTLAPDERQYYDIEIKFGLSI